MTTANLTDIRNSYERDGYCFPIDAMTPERARCCRDELEQVEAGIKQAGDDSAVLFTHANFVLPFIDEITRLASVLEPVKAILGSNLLVWNASFFTKEADTTDFVSWHQDLTYWGLDDVEEVTAWIAFSAVTVESGCMRFLPCSHKQDIVPHRDTFADVNMLSRGQELAVDVDESRTVDVVLEPGQMSLHHGHIFHASHANQSQDRRIGLAIRYITPSMSQVGGEKSYAHLVSGEDSIGNFHLLPAPNGTLLSEDLELARRNVEALEKYFYAGAEAQGKRLR
jgi:non-heme Fe2+,alpha-ketoglutarate-dependent halogenase